MRILSQIRGTERRMTTSSKERMSLEEARDKITWLAMIGSFVALVLAIWGLYLH
jgi:hypothetical protein